LVLVHRDPFVIKICGMTLRQGRTALPVKATGLFPLSNTTGAPQFSSL
jgi:hypothetical protein